MLNINFIIDGNYMLNKLVFPLHKEKRLYGDLFHELNYTLSQYLKLGNFKNIDIVCDSREKSWRKDIYPEYKAHRKKDEDINWEYVNTVYDNFIDDIKAKNKIKVYRKNKIEGDDYISYLIRKYNNDGISCLVMTNDRDICQFVNTSNDYKVINVMFNDQKSKDKVFVPNTYDLFVKYKSGSDELEYVFDMNETIRHDEVDDEAVFLSDFIFERYRVDIDSNYMLLEKIICGDTGDNIRSVAVYKERGIKEAGFTKFYNAFIEKYSIPIVHEHLDDNILLFKDLAKELVVFKKIPSELYDEYVNKFYDALVLNFKIINLRTLPDNIEKMLSDDINHKKSIF